MKAYGILGAFIFTLGSWTAQAATPIPLSGEYSFKGQIVEGSVSDYRVVYTFTDAGKVELRDLRSQGYYCEVKPRDTFLCQKIIASDGLPDVVRERVISRFNGYSVAFLNHAPEAPDIPENNAPDLKEWRIIQKVRIGETYYPFYRYQILGDTLHKIALGESGDEGAPYFVVNSGSQLSVIADVSKSNSKGYRIYRLQVVLNLN